jgi:hypothetical protein
VHHHQTLESVAAATRDFVHNVARQGLGRIVAQVAGHDGMPVLCAVEAALADSLPDRATQELIWLTGGPARGVHRLRLVAYGDGGDLLAESAREFMS